MRGESPEDEPSDDKPKKEPRWKLRIGVGVAVLLVVALAVTAGAYAWNRWARYDDAADMQGIWYAYGTQVPVTFTEDAIVFDANTAYTYSIDPGAKTISYSIGDMNGQGRYWFSDDRTVLIITDGEGYTQWVTMCEDIGHWVSGLFNGVSLPMSEHSIAFSRMAMNKELLTVEPAEEPAAEPTDQTEPTESAEPSESTSSSSGGSSSSSGSADEKVELSKAPISDIVEKDTTPRWGESDE